MKLKALEILIDLRDNFIYGELHGSINQAINELEELEIKESCATCKHKLLCKKAENTKLNWGFKLSEMWFNCWELR